MTAISNYMVCGNILTEGLEELVLSLIDRGYPIEKKNGSNVYVMRRKKKFLVVTHPFTTNFTTNR